MYFIKPFSLIVRYFGLIEAHGLVGDVPTHEDWRPKEPKLFVLRFWTRTGLNRYLDRSQIRDAKQESKYVHSCVYMEDGSMNMC